VNPSERACQIVHEVPNRKGKYGYTGGAYKIPIQKVDVRTERERGVQKTKSGNQCFGAGYFGGEGVGHARGRCGRRAFLSPVTDALLEEVRQSDQLEG